MIKFDIEIIKDRLEFDFRANGKWYIVNKNKKIQLEIKDPDIQAALNDILLSSDAEKDDIIEFLLVIALTKLEGRL